MDIRKDIRKDIIEVDFWRVIKANDYVSSSLIDTVFIPGRRLPKSIIDNLVTDPKELEQTLLAERPIFTTPKMSLNWWKERPYDEMVIDIYGSLCLADDRHVLDMIISCGAPLKNASKYTLRTVIEEGMGLKADEQYCMKDKTFLDRPLKNHGLYWRVDANELLKLLDLKVCSENRNRLLDRLNRLSIMHLVLKFSKDGDELPERVKMNLVDKDFFPLIDRNKIRNKNNITTDTYTDLLINIDDRYVQSLKDDGHIDRSRLLNQYPKLNGTSSVVDFFKFIDKHKRRYINGKYLSELIDMYFEGKMDMFGINIRKKRLELMHQVIKKKDTLPQTHSIRLLKQSDMFGKVNDYILSYSASDD